MRAKQASIMCSLVLVLAMVGPSMIAADARLVHRPRPRTT